MSCGHREVDVVEIPGLLGTATLPGRIRQVDYFRAASKDIGVVFSSAAAVHQEVPGAVGGFGRFPAGEDLEFWARAALRFGVAVSDAPTAFYVRGVGGIMDTLTASRSEWPSSPPPASAVRDLSPSAATVARALDGRGAELPARSLSLVRYLNARVQGGMRGAIWRGDHRRARALGRLLQRPRSARDLAALAVAHCPASVVQALLQARQRARESLRR